MAKKEIKKDELKTVEETAKELFDLVGIKGDFKVLESDGSFDIILETEESGIVIGRHGDTLESLQLVLSLCVFKKLGEFRRISLEVGDYKKNRTDWLNTLAQETKERVLAQGAEISIPELKAWERRVVHLLLENDEKVISESRGEGRDRVLVVRPR